MTVTVRNAGLLTFNQDGNYPSYYYPLEAEFSLPAIVADWIHKPNATPALKPS